jgi:hypothetical protein
MVPNVYYLVLYRTTKFVHFPHSFWIKRRKETGLRCDYRMFDSFHLILSELIFAMGFHKYKKKDILDH